MSETAHSPIGQPRRIRAGLIGAGGIATIAHLPTLKAHEDRVEVVGVADLDPDRVNQLADEWGSRAATARRRSC